MDSPDRQKGFTLILVVAMLGVLAMVAAIAIPAALRIFEVTAEETTRDEMEDLKIAMVGNPRKLQSDERSDFAFLGDIGRLPTSLDEILVRGSLPAFSFDTSKGAGAGWKGPYITGAAAGEEAEDFKKDQWGNSYTYSDADFTNSNGEQADGKITSAGPDGVLGTADDVVVEILKSETTGTVKGAVKDSGGAAMAGIAVELYAAVNGVLTTTTATTDSSGNYTFTSVPFGYRAVKANPSTLHLVSGSVTVSGGDNNHVSFKVTNFSSSSITISHMKIDCESPAAQNDEIEIDGQTVNSQEKVKCGTQRSVSGSNTTFSASSTTPAPMRAVVASSETQLPDLTVSGGTTRTIRLRDFENSSGSNVDMRGGKTITVTFYSDASTVITTVTVVTP